MWWLILEACGALFILVFIVWWTMFSGRKDHTGKAPAQTQDMKDSDQP